MSFSFFKPSRPKTPPEVAKAIKDSLNALDTKTVAEVKALEKAMEEVEKNFVTMRCMLSGDGEVEPNVEQISQLALEISKEDVISLVVHKLPILGWEARKDLVHCWSIFLKQQVDSKYCCVEYIEKNLELLDFLVVCYDNKEIALNCGNMLRECIKFPSLAQYILNSASFVLFFKFVELPNFDVASDAFSTFKDILTKHASLVAEYLTGHYDEFFDLYEKLLTSSNYVTRRQSLKLLSDFLLEAPNVQIMKRYILEVRYLKIMMTLLRVHSNFSFSMIWLVFIDLNHPSAVLMLLELDSVGYGYVSDMSTSFSRVLCICEVFVANPNKPREIKIILAKNHEKLLELLNSLSGKGAEDEQFEEEKELIIKEIEKVSRLQSLKS
ncbi:Calcium-binding 39 [Gossypium arboreum]|uniref:Calcium-binding 39 n=1 Tax=Gossypium arboreum TaxID=29729 RepID=A0A0B0P5M4_GOSAR|nr:Calcium-binding 39 [Gossypium arboreum]